MVLNRGIILVNLLLCSLLLSAFINVVAAGAERVGGRRLAGENPLTAKAALTRYWENKISNKLPKPQFLLDKASPLNALDLATFSKLAEQKYLPAHLDEFCSKANLLCGQDLITTLQKQYNNTQREIRNYKVEPGMYFRERVLKPGTLMPMADIKDKLPKRSFLPRAIVSKLPFSSSRLSDQFKEIFQAGYDEKSGNLAGYDEKSGNLVGYHSNDGKGNNQNPGYMTAYGNKASVLTSESQKSAYMTAYGEKAGYIDREGEKLDYMTAYDQKAGYVVGEGENSGYMTAYGQKAGYLASEGENPGYMTAYGQKAGYVAGEVENLGYMTAYGQKAGFVAGEGENLGYTTAYGQKESFVAGEGKNLGYMTAYGQKASFVAGEAGGKSGYMTAYGQKASYVSGEGVKAGNHQGVTTKTKVIKEVTEVSRDIRGDHNKRSSHFHVSGIIGSKIALHECARAPNPGEMKQCVGSEEDMIDFATSYLGRNIEVRVTENTSGVKDEILIGTVKGINSGWITKTVICHQTLHPYLMYNCHSVPHVRMYEAEILDPTTKVKINTGVALCHLNTSTWTHHEAFLGLGSSPGKIEVCHWVFENDVAWVIAE